MGRRGPVRPAYGSGEENQTSELRESGVAGPADLRRRSQGASCLLPRSRGRGSGWGTGNGAARDGPTGVRLRARGIGRLNCESVVAGRLIWGRSAAKRRVAGAGVREGVKRPGNQLGVDRPPRGVAGNPSPGPNPPPPFRWAAPTTTPRPWLLEVEPACNAHKGAGGPWRGAVARGERRRRGGGGGGRSERPSDRPVPRSPARSRPLSRAGGGAGAGATWQPEAGKEKISAPHRRRSRPP